MRGVRATCGPGTTGAASPRPTRRRSTRESTTSTAYFFLGAAGNLHTGYLRNPARKGGYERRPTREAVLLNLINPGPYSLADYHRWKRLLKRFGGWQGVFEALEEERGDR